MILTDHQKETIRQARQCATQAGEIQNSIEVSILRERQMLACIDQLVHWNQELQRIINDHQPTQAY
jgi:hypothetical protein